MLQDEILQQDYSSLEHTGKLNMPNSWEPDEVAILDYADDPDEAPVYNFDEDIDMPSVCIKIGWRSCIGV